MEFEQLAQAAAHAIASRACTIRRARADDAATLAAFGARTFVDTYGDFRADDLALHLARTYGEAQQLREIADPDVATWLAHGGGALAAFAQVRRGPAPPCVAGRDPVELHRLYVERAWHGRGVAQRLIAAACDAALAFGGATLWLKVWQRNARAIAFYRKCGFADVGETAFVVGNDATTDRVLVLELDRAPRGEGFASILRNGR
ncbi:GNAT family N-acetyltransferase [Tahibacter soli]|uniref:GNAT family N-acetyltransferase n=1 Tax=Tahibacter soli TaxID=2983605 RepID=A0A9X3YQA5_9GAMM|nr:GNAT family N-acetyltransferase [Tahibacter soli]MDC8014948.1 GNAT family N-acetyltransferase [Tahibacter soli]